MVILDFFFVKNMLARICSRFVGCLVLEKQVTPELRRARNSARYARFRLGSAEDHGNVSTAAGGDTWRTAN